MSFKIIFIIISSQQYKRQHLDVLYWITALDAFNIPAKILENFKKSAKIKLESFLLLSIFCGMHQKVIISFRENYKNTAIQHFKTNFGFLNIFENISGFTNPMIGNTYTLHRQYLTNFEKLKKSKNNSQKQFIFK